jgi:ribosomal protein L34
MATVSPSLVLKPVVVFLVEPHNQGGGGFPDLGLKTGSSDLMICASKSPRQFLGLGLKTKRTTIYRLRHKTDGGRSVWDTRRDLTACFMWKQVWLGFLSLA